MYAALYEQGNPKPIGVITEKIAKLAIEDLSILTGTYYFSKPISSAEAEKINEDEISKKFSEELEKILIRKE